MKIQIDNKITIQDVPQDLMAELKSKLSFINPQWTQNDRLGYSNWNTPHTLKFYEISDNGDLILPRGFARQLLSLHLCKDYELQDNRRTLPEIDITFKGTLRGYQTNAVSDVLGHDFGVLSAPPGSGKTVMCLSVIAKRRQPTLIIVHTKELLNQWVSRIEQFLGIPKEQVGIIGGGKKEVGEQITVALIQSLYKVASEISKSIGFLICDEVHRAPARTFMEAVTSFDAKYQLGLSATPWRRDGLSRLIFYYLGDAVHEIEKEDLIESGDILEAEVVTRETDFNTLLNASEEYSRMLLELTQDDKRNALIVKDVVSEANNGRGVCLVLSDRKAHCEALKGLLRGHGVRSELLTGDVPGKEREEIVKRLDAGKIKVLISTTQLLGEGFDSKQLTTLFMASPIKFSGRLIQSVGRILRPMQDKEPKVYDYRDGKIGVLRASFEARQRVYNN